jgi:7-cyano-7-deazaguanine synthase
MSSLVLYSGGLDSAVLLAREREQHDDVWPVYVRSGLAWEATELAAASRLLRVPPFANRMRPLVVIDASLADVYPATHWALTGTPPAYDTPDEDVYLEGRNLVLIAKTAVLAPRLGADRLVLGLLEGNPFPDATPEFLAAMTAAVSLGLKHPLTIATPFSTMHKEDVIRLGRSLGVPLELTLSCANSTDGAPCGRCSKCRERDDAFAGVVRRPGL